MGNCITLRRRNRSDRRSDDRPPRVRNQPLRRHISKWKSETPLTVGQLYSRRDEFWETAAHFDGRKEIWDGLRAAVVATEQDDLTLAQAIIDGANIIIPNGTLSEAYDELGNKYVVPIYCLSKPLNLLCEDCEDSPNKDAIPAVDTVSEDPADLENHVMRLRLSSSGAEETEISLRGSDTVLTGKKVLGMGNAYAGLRQRWFYGGRLLEDKKKIRDLNIPSNHVVQVVFCPPIAE